MNRLLLRVKGFLDCQDFFNLSCGLTRIIVRVWSISAIIVGGILNFRFLFLHLMQIFQDFNTIIQCKLQRKHGQDVAFGDYKWNPSSIDGAADLCGIKERCAKPQSMYNLTNKLLSHEKFTEGRRIFYNFRYNEFFTLFTIFPNFSQF